MQRAMRNADSSFQRKVGASFVAASFRSDLCTTLAAFLLRNIRSVPNAYSSLLDLVGASFMAAISTLCSMSNTDSSHEGFVGASFMTAYYTSNLCSMPNAYTSLLDFVGAPFMIAFFVLVLCSMLHTDSFLPSSGAGASVMAAFPSLFTRCTVPNAASSPLDNIGASLMTA